MARPIRIEYPGAVYHVTARGNERRKIFRGDKDRQCFLDTLIEAVEQFGLRLHGFCLMPNHFHLLVETPQANLSRGIGWLQTTYSIRFNRRHKRSGHLFQGRFKAHLVEAKSYAKTVLRYLHLNPVRPRDKSAPVPRERRPALEQYRWSSHRAYLGREAAPAWLCTEWLRFFGRPTASARREYGRFVAAAFGRVVESPWEGLRLGLVLGGEELLARVRALVKAKPKSDERRWTARADRGGKRLAAARALAKREKERR
jgi:REP element-mobilizing transposase RayT